MDVNRSKQRLRQQILAARHRRFRDSAAAAAADRGIVDRIIAEATRSGARGIAAYSPMPGEPGGGLLVERLIRYAAGEGGSLWLPVCRPDRTLGWAPVTDTGDLRTGSWGIREPVGRTVPTHALNGLVDLMVVPAVACGRDGSRLGRGAGYYDRALAVIDRTRIRVVAAVPAADLVPTVPTGAHDLPVDAVLTESGTVAVTG